MGRGKNHLAASSGDAVCQTWRALAAVAGRGTRAGNSAGRRPGGEEIVFGFQGRGVLAAGEDSPPCRPGGRWCSAKAIFRVPQ